jgi:hypothetical protein
LEYVARIDDLIEASLSREALADEDQQCRHCTNDNVANWRCKDCNMGISMCRACIRRFHKMNPFHQIEQWNGQFFRPANLWEVGAYLLVRHHKGITICERLIAQERFLEDYEKRQDVAEQESLKAAPGLSRYSTTESVRSSSITDLEDVHISASNSHPSQNDSMEHNEQTDVQADEEFIRYIQKLKDDAGNETINADNRNELDEDLEDDVEEDEIDEPEVNRYLPDKIEFEIPAGPGSSNSSAQQIMGSYIRVVHTNGIHNIAMIHCECQGHNMLPNDLIASRLLPASFERIRTLFSAQVLDHFRLCNLELKSSAYHFYHLLRRLTSPMAPDSVVDLYREFRRMSRIWRWIKHLKWAGFGNIDKKAKDVTPGQLAVFCPACPQVGVNIPENWKADPARYVFNSTDILYLIYYCIG